MQCSMEKKIDWPSEIIFKSVFKNKPFIMESIQTLLSENGIDAKITSKESKNSKFISYTVTAVFESDENLKSICGKIATIDGYMTMF